MDEVSFQSLIMAACNEAGNQKEAELEYNLFIRENPEDCCNLLLSLIMSKPITEITIAASSLLRVALIYPNDLLREFIANDDIIIDNLIIEIQQELPYNIKDTICDCILFITDIKLNQKIEILGILDIIDLATSDNASTARAALSVVTGLLYRMPPNPNYYYHVTEIIKTIQENRPNEYGLIVKSFEAIFAISVSDFECSHFFIFWIEWIKQLNNEQIANVISLTGLFYSQIQKYIILFRQEIYELLLELLYNEETTEDVKKEALAFVATLSQANFQNLCETDSQINLPFDKDPTFSIGKIMSLLFTFSTFYNEDYDVTIDESLDKSIGSTSIEMVGSTLSMYDGVPTIYADVWIAIEFLIEGDFNDVVAGLKLIPIIFRHGIHCIDGDLINLMMDKLLSACESEDERLKHVGANSLLELVDDFEDGYNLSDLDLNSWFQRIYLLIEAESEQLYLQLFYKILNKIFSSYPEILNTFVDQAIEIAIAGISTDDVDIVTQSIEMYTEVMKKKFSKAEESLPNIVELIQQILEIFNEEKNDLYFVSLKSLSEVLLKTKDEKLCMFITEHMFSIDINELHYSQLDFYHFILNSIITTNLVDINENICQLFKNIVELLLDQPEPKLVRKTEIEYYYETYFIAKEVNQEYMLYEVTHILFVRNLLDILTMLIPFIFENQELIQMLFNLYKGLLGIPICTLILGQISRGLKLCKHQVFSQVLKDCIFTLVYISNNFKNLKECIPPIHEALSHFIRNNLFSENEAKSVIHAFICFCHVIEANFYQKAFQDSIRDFIVDDGSYDIEKIIADMFAIFFEFYPDESNLLVSQNLDKFNIEPITLGNNIIIHFMYIEILSIYANYNSDFDFNSLFLNIFDNYESLDSSQYEIALRVLTRLIPLSQEVEENVFPLFSSYLESKMEGCEYMYLQALHNASEKGKWAGQFNSTFTDKFTRGSLYDFFGFESLSLQAIHEAAVVFLDLISYVDPSPLLKHCLLNIATFMKQHLDESTIEDKATIDFLNAFNKTG